MGTRVVLLKGGGAPRRADRILVSAWGEGETNADGLDGKGRGWTGFHANEVNTEGRESMIGRTSSKGKESKKDLPLIQNLLSEFFGMENSSRSVAPRFSFHPKMVPTPEWKPIPNTTPTKRHPSLDANDGGTGNDANDGIAEGQPLAGKSLSGVPFSTVSMEVFGID